MDLAGNTYVNHWKADSQMCSFEDRRFQPLGLRTKDTIWDAARPVLEAWIGEKLKPTSLYGIRRYDTDAILATHVDRLPLVTSAIINVDQDVRGRVLPRRASRGAHELRPARRIVARSLSLKRGMRMAVP